MYRPISLPSEVTGSFRSHETHTWQRQQLVEEERPCGHKGRSKDDYPEDKNKYRVESLHLSERTKLVGMNIKVQ